MNNAMPCTDLCKYMMFKEVTQLNPICAMTLFWNPTVTYEHRNTMILKNYLTSVSQLQNITLRFIGHAVTKQFRLILYKHWWSRSWQVKGLGRSRMFQNIFTRKYQRSLFKPENFLKPKAMKKVTWFTFFVRYELI